MRGRAVAFAAFPVSRGRSLARSGFCEVEEPPSESLLLGVAEEGDIFGDHLIRGETRWCPAPAMADTWQEDLEEVLS